MLSYFSLVGSFDIHSLLCGKQRGKFVIFDTYMLALRCLINYLQDFKTAWTFQNVEMSKPGSLLLYHFVLFKKFDDIFRQPLWKFHFLIAI